MNLILRKRQRNKKTNELSDNYTNVGYYSNVTSLLTRLNNEVVLSHLQGLDSLDELVRVTESYLSKLHDDFLVVYESASSEISAIPDSFEKKLKKTMAEESPLEQQNKGYISYRNVLQTACLRKKC